jgi:uracil-DNA glycosylase
LPEYFVLPHPAPRNRFWLAQNKCLPVGQTGFEKETIPLLLRKVKAVLK